MLQRGQYEKAAEYFKQLTEEYSQSVHSRYGLARALLLKADAMQSNSVLQLLLDELENALNYPDVSDDLYLEMGLLRASKLKFKGANIARFSI